MQFKPLSNRVLVEVITQEKTKGGVYIPSIVNPTSLQKGKVVSVGPGAVTMSGDLIPMEVTQGDVVVFRPSQGSELLVEDGKYLLFHETDLMGVLH